MVHTLFVNGIVTRGMNERGPEEGIFIHTWVIPVASSGLHTDLSINNSVPRLVINLTRKFASCCGPGAAFPYINFITVDDNDSGDL